ncbi:tryptophan aminotransferase-related protein 1-like, partial [Phalaenopsis equestris]|uniref:tryptophan aminotransferase-related protein 1-like n=1 Tax=Phalaenopsis equestris TaxID=78828 RepID=UPI0009E35D45
MHGHEQGYPAAADFLKSTLYKWGGDANTFTPHPSTPYIEVICSPNNPDGRLNNPVLLNQNSNNIHDLAYYWPQYTPITKAADHDIMLFTISKCTGHAGCRLGWALVKDADLARRMVKFVELGTIGVSKDSQHRAAAILRAVSNGYESGGACKLFHFGRKMMAERWERVREVVKAKGAFGLLEYPPPSYCGFLREEATHLP